MNGTFVPLNVTRPAEEFLAAHAPTPAPSKPGTSEPAGENPGNHATACGMAVRREPVVELIRDGSRVSHLKITCGCGEVITIECQF